MDANDGLKDPPLGAANDMAGRWKRQPVGSWETTLGRWKLLLVISVVYGLVIFANFKKLIFLFDGPKALTAVFQLSGELDCFRKGFVQITLTVRKTHLLSEGEVNLASCYGWGQLLHDVIPQNGPWVYLAVDMCTPNTTLFLVLSCGCRCKP